MTNVNVRSERGQVLVITAGALLTLLAVAALVIDLGMSWMLRRDLQNVVDPGALAAARYIPSGDQAGMREMACRYARESGHFPSATTNDLGPSGCVPANDPRSATLEVRYPPVGPLAGQYAATPGYVQVLMTSNHPGFFGSMFGRDPAYVTSSAVGAWTDDNANSSSLVALDPTCDNGPGGKISGSNATIEIVPAPGVTGDGGYVHVNSSCATHPSGAPDACGNGTTDLKIDSANLITPHAYVHGVCTTNGAGANLTCPAGVTDCLTEGAAQIGDPLASLIAPTIAEINAAYGVANCPNGQPSTITSTAPCEFRSNRCDDADGTPACEVEPGVYYGGWNITQNGVQVKLSPGIYYIAGGGIRLNSGTIESISGDPSVEGRALIYSTDHPTKCSAATPDWCQGPIRLQAQSTFAAKGLNQNTCDSQPVTCPYRGMLVWQEGRVLSPGSEVRLGGQNTSVVAGTIYAPKSEVILNGGSNGTGCSGANQACLSVQIIAWRFDVTGGGYLKMPYDPGQLYQVQNKGLVH